MIETMSLNEATEYLRQHGMRITNTTLGAGIQQGIYPFAICIQGGVKPVYQIFTRLLDEWIERRATPKK